MPKSIATPVALQNNTAKLPLFMGGEPDNALGQITFTFDEWQSLSNALDEYAQFDYAGVYQLIIDRVIDQSECYTLNLYCYEQINVEILEFIALAVIHSQSDILSNKLSQAINEQVNYWGLLYLSKSMDIEQFTIETNNLGESLNNLLSFYPIFTKGGNQ